MEQSLLQTRQETAMTTTRDPFAADPGEDPRSARQRVTDIERDLAARRDRGEISQQDYERQVAELEQAEQDFRRGQDLEREMPPGEVDQEIDETD
jgi:hypothetical protein